MLDKGQNAAAEPAASAPERLGRYELIARIADGGMAEVYLARQLGPMNFQKLVVVKKIHPHLARQKEFIGMLLDEARISALIKHPRVVDIYDLGVARGTYFIAMEYLSGQPLTNVITRGRVRSPLDVYSTARIVADAAEGLHAAHNLKTLSGRALELVHRDVSPSNIVVLYDGSVKLVDFGVAKARGRITETDGNQIKGKVGYVSPEQIMENPTDRRSDVFSLGVVMWEALALRRLFDAESEAGKLKQILDGVPLPPSAHRPEVPYELDKICLRALAVKPDERFQSAGDMQIAIESFLRDANYRREGAAIARFMSETFLPERQEEEQLLLRVADADRASAARTKNKTPAPVTRKPEAVPVPLAASASSPTMTDPGAGQTPVSVPKPGDPAEITQTDAGDLVTATGQTAPAPRRPDEPEIDTGVRTFVHRPGEVSSVRIGDHAKAARAAVFAPPAAVTADKVEEPPAEDRTRPTRVLAGGTPSRAMSPGGSKKILRADTAETTVPGAHPALSDPDGIITQLPTSKPRGKRRTTGRQQLRNEAPQDAVPTAQLRQSSSRILPLPPPKADEPPLEAEHPFEDADDGEDDVDITEVDSTAGKKFEELLSVGAAQPVAVASPEPVPVPPPPVLPPVQVDAATEVEDVEELSRIDVIDTSGGRRRLWIVGGVAAAATVLVALSMVWALDASSSDDGRETPALAAGETPAASEPLQALPSEPPAPEPAPEVAPPREVPPPPIAGKPKAAPPPEHEKPKVAPPSEHEKSKPPKPAVAPAPRKKPTASSSEAAASTGAPAAPTANPAQLYKEGAQLTLAGKLPEAQKKYIAALRVSPGFAPALRGLGLVYEKSGQKGKAIKSLQAYLRLAPKAADAAAIRARIERLRN